MRFGLFGSAQARRSGPDTDSSQGFREFIDSNVEAEALGYYSTFLVEPPTAQKPHPPFWMGAGSPSSVHQVVERGYNMLLGQHSLAEEILDQVAQFREEVEARGRAFDPMHAAVARAVHIAKNAAD